MKKTITLALAAFGLSVAAQEATVLPPTMGWSSWNTFAAKISDDIICSQAKAMADLGFADAGYNYVNIDDGYFARRDENGRLIIHPERFPRGMKPVVDYIHSLGLKAGCYSDGGHNTCASYWGGEDGGIGAGMYEHDAQDCDMYFNEYDFDFIKVDFCGGVNYHNSEKLDLDPQERYTAIRKAIDECGHPEVVMNVCRWDYPGTWVSDVSNSWRISQDIEANWKSVKNIIWQSLYLAPYASPGHYNDMDMLEVGRGMTADEDITHFGMWCIMSSPLLIGCDLTKVTDEAKALMTNPELIALNQDPLGLQAYVAVKTPEGAYILVKDYEQLRGTRRAVALYNPTDAPVEVTLNFADVDLGGEVSVRDLVAREDLGSMSESITLPLRKHASAFLLLDAAERLPRTIYEGEHAYFPQYQELVNNEVAKTAIYTEPSQARNGAVASWLGCSPENNMQWRDVYVDKAGLYTMTVYYISGEDRYIDITVNGEKLATIEKCNSGGWGKIASFSIDVPLKEGDNNITLSNSTTWMPDIDYMIITPKDASVETVLAEADPSPLYDLHGRILSADSHPSLYIQSGKVHFSPQAPCPAE